MRVGLYARVSTHDQHTIKMQIESMNDYVQVRDWRVILCIEEISSGVSERKQREKLLFAARRRKIDAIIVWKLDRWGRSLVDLVVTLKELNDLGIGFISLTEALDFTTPIGRAMAGLLAVFAEFERDLLSERVKAGIAYARKLGKPHGRPISVAKKANNVIELFELGWSKSKIARELDIGRTSVRRFIQQKLDEENKDF